MADSWVAKPQKLVTRPIELFGRKVLVGLRSLGGFGLFMKDVLYWAVRRPFRFRILFQQLEFIGNQSLNIMLISALAVGYRQGPMPGAGAAGLGDFAHRPGRVVYDR